MTKQDILKRIEQIWKCGKETYKDTYYDYRMINMVNDLLKDLEKEVKDD